jgi:hypothetical protein
MQPEVHAPSPCRVRVPGSMRLVSAVSVLLAAAWLAARPGLAWAAPFQSGDVFVANSQGVEEYSPTGQLTQTVTQSSGATSLCFDPAGQHLVVPGVGLFDRSGNPLPSNWATVTNGNACVADQFGDVYVSGGSSTTGSTITKYDLKGGLLQTFNVASSGNPPLAIDIAPDQCTIYYGQWSDVDGIDRFNACTNHPESAFNGFQFVDDLRVLPNGQVLVASDGAALLYDSSGQLTQRYVPPPPGFIYTSVRSVSLDPDGSSFWMCCSPLDSSGQLDVSRLDLKSGTLLAQWAPRKGDGAIAVYGPSAPAATNPGGWGSGGNPVPTAGTVHSGSSPTSGNSAGHAGPSLAYIKSLLSKVLVPQGNMANIETLLFDGGYSFHWNAPSAGRLVITWYSAPDRGPHRPAVVIATLRQCITSAGSDKVAVVLTRAGRRRLESVERLRLTAKGSFVTADKSATTALTKGFTLRR